MFSLFFFNLDIRDSLIEFTTCLPLLGYLVPNSENPTHKSVLILSLLTATQHCLLVGWFYDMPTLVDVFKDKICMGHCSILVFGMTSFEEIVWIRIDARKKLEEYKMQRYVWISLNPRTYNKKKTFILSNTNLFYMFTTNIIYYHIPLFSHPLPLSSHYFPYAFQCN